MASETSVQQQTMLALAAIDGHAWRNNVGVAVDDTGRHIRYGLANSSAQMNAVIKSSDVIGIVPVTAWLHSAQAWVKLGVFTALETKRPGWQFKPSDERAVAQKRYIDIVREAGGYAGFVTDPAQINGIIRRW